MATRKLTKLNMIGKRAVFYYLKDGGGYERIVKTTAEYGEKFENLDKVGVPPAPANTTYSFGAVKPEYDGVNGDLPNDSYAVLTDRVDDACVLKMAEHPEHNDVIVKNSEILNDEIDIDLLISKTQCILAQ